MISCLVYLILLNHVNYKKQKQKQTYKHKTKQNKKQTKKNLLYALTMLTSRKH